MNAKKKRNWIGSAISALLGTACALVLGFLFYSAMAYQLLDDEGQANGTAQSGDNLSLALSGVQMISEQTVTGEYGGVLCSALVRSYKLDGGEKVEAITAQPAAYIERLSEEEYTPQLITGFVLAGMDAVYALRGDQAALCARSGNTIYMLCASADEQTMYALGAGAYLK